MEEMIRRIPSTERMIIGADLNAHLGENNDNYKEEHGQHGYGTGNKEGDMWLEVMQANQLFAINTGFRKQMEHLITYKSGNNATQIDHIMIRQKNRKDVPNAKVIPYEAISSQHRFLVPLLVRWRLRVGKDSGNVHPTNLSLSRPSSLWNAEKTKNDIPHRPSRALPRGASLSEQPG